MHIPILFFSIIHHSVPSLSAYVKHEAHTLINDQYNEIKWFIMVHNLRFLNGLSFLSRVLACCCDNRFIFCSLTYVFDRSMIWIAIKYKLDSKIIMKIYAWISTYYRLGLLSTLSTCCFPCGTFNSYFNNSYCVLLIDF